MPKQVTASVPAPVGGINARDSIVAMPQTDALTMENWWPQPYGVSVRKGYQIWASGLDGSVGTLATYTGANGAYNFFAWANDSFYDITTPGPVAAPLLTGLSTDVWSTINLSNSAGKYLLAVNGVDDGIVYDGTTVGRITSDTIPAQWSVWTGLDPKNAAQLTVHQHRVWAVEKETAKGWYSAPDAIQGAFTDYDFGPLLSRGGNLAFITTWTIDDGNGAEDHLVAVSFNGEAVVFGGTDPSDDTKWSLVGVYYVGGPVAGRKSYTKAGGDLLFLTQQGVVSMKAMLVSTQVKEAENPLTTKKVQYLASEAISKYSTLDGWAIAYYPKHNILIINIPNTNPASTTQLAANQITGAWTTFLNMPAASWGFNGAQPMFGGYDGNVYLAWTGDKDGANADGTGGKGIIAKVQQAYSYIGSPARQNQVGMYRPVLASGNLVGLKTAIQYDFAERFVNTPNAESAERIANDWDVGKWDVALWDGGKIVQKQWIQGEGMGVAASLKMVTNTEEEVLWISTDFVILNGEGVF